jgi:hypothetical protein
MLRTIEVKESTAMTSRCFHYSRLLLQIREKSPNFICDLLLYTMWVTLVNIHNFSTILRPKWQVMYVERNIKARSHYHYCRGQAIKQYILHILDCVLRSFRYQDAKRTHRAVLSPMACLPLTYISTLSHKRHDFQKKKRYWTSNMCFGSL